MIDQDWLNLVDDFTPLFPEVLLPEETDYLELPLPLTDDVNISSSIDCPLLDLESSMDINELLNNEINQTMCENNQHVTKITSVAQQPDINEIASTIPQFDINSESIELLLLQNVLIDDVNNGTYEDGDVLSHVVADSILDSNKNDETILSTINLDELPLQQSLPRKETTVDEPSSSKKLKRKSASLVQKDEDTESHSEAKKKRNISGGEKYLEIRRKNNIASQRSRYNRKCGEKEMEEKCMKLRKENEILKDKAKKLKEVVDELKSLLINSIVNGKKKESN